jgi:SAM-dependent methyltransferase
VVVARAPSPQDLLDHYWEYSYGNDDAWKIMSATETSLASLAARLKPFRTTGRLLDIGCGSGVVLSVMARHGWVAEGTELSWVAAERLRQEGFQVHVGDLEQLNLREGSFDVVILSEVVEHLLEPRLALARARDLLRPGGALYLTTPNFDALSRWVLGARWRIISPAEHLCYFTPKSLRRLLFHVGLHPLSVATEGLSPFELLAALQARRPTATAESRTQTLRELSAGRGPLAPLKAVVNALLRTTRLGDTLKAFAVRPRD